MPKMTVALTEADLKASATAALTLFDTGHFDAALRMDDLARQMSSTLSGLEEAQSPLEACGKRAECESLAQEVDANT